MGDLPARDLVAITDGVLARLEAKHQAREAALRESRLSIRNSANAIRAIHRGERELAESLLAEAEAALLAAQTATEGQPEIEFAGFVLDAKKEYAEARTTFAVIAGEPLPAPADLGVEDAPYLNGVAETVGELRRHLLDELRRGHLERCEAVLAIMDDIYSVLVTIDYPDGITGGLRRSTDVARSILERTRGDLTTALLQAQVRDALESHRELLDAGETPSS